MKFAVIFLGLFVFVLARTTHYRGGRIVGGRDADIGAAPYQVSLKWNGNHLCGGAIISDRWILTAAHCLKGWSPGFITVYAGSNHLTKGGKSFKCDKFFRHELHEQPEYHNDIGLIKLKDSIEFSNLIKPIPLRKARAPDQAFPVVLTGWGDIVAGGGGPAELQTIDLYHIELDECRELTEPEYRQDVGEGHMCTYNGFGQGACNGDSGGPLVYEGELVGLVNWGIPCAYGFPDVHASVPYYIDWIDQKIAENS